MRSDLAALGAVFLWASLATLAIALEALPPLLMTGIGLLIGSLISVFLAKGSFSKLIPKPKILLLGVYGLFGYHVALFAGLQNAPAVQANLANYFWPLLIVVLAPLFFQPAQAKDETCFRWTHWFYGRRNCDFERQPSNRGIRDWLPLRHNGSIHMGHLLPWLEKNWEFSNRSGWELWPGRGISCTSSAFCFGDSG